MLNFSKSGEKRPAFPQLPLDLELDAFEPVEKINLDPELLMKNLQTATANLRPLLESDRYLAVFHQFAHIMARDGS